MNTKQLDIILYNYNNNKMDDILKNICEKFNISQSYLENLVNKSSNKIILKTINERYKFDHDLKYEYLNGEKRIKNNEYLIDVFDNYHLFSDNKLNEDLNKYPHIKPQKNFTQNLANNIDEFKLRLDKITNNQLKHLKWNKKIVIAGGIINSAFTGKNDHCDNSDIDIFIVDEVSEEEFKTIVEETYNSLSYNKIIYKTSTSINILANKPYRPVQIPLKITYDLTQLLLFFDLDCAAIAYDGEKLYTLPRFIDCINTGYNMLDVMRATKKIYIDRINKYTLRGYGFLISPFNNTKILKNELDDIILKLGEINKIEYHDDIINSDTNNIE